MSWSNIKELILQERKTLEPSGTVEFPQESAFESQHSAMLACYLKTKSHVDAAVSQFAHTLEWPEMTFLERYFVVARLDFAWEVASVLNTFHDGDAVIDYPTQNKCRTADILEWLLIDVWPYGCGRFLQAQKSVAEQVITMPIRPMRPAPEMVKAKCVA